jgi:uncharacterized protein
MIQREIMPQIVPYLESPEAIVITGMRRVGKTTLLMELYQRVDTANKVYLDFENPINRRYFEDDNYEGIAAALKFLGIDLKQRAAIFLDEVQFVPTLPSVVKYLGDHYSMKFFLTGSASFYLKNLFSESLSGRKYLFELHPLSFREFLLVKNASVRIPDAPAPIPRPIFDTLAPLYDEYLLYGGFPGVVAKDSQAEKKLALGDIFSSYFNMEVTQLGDFKKNNTVRDLMLLVMQRTGTRYDVQRLAVELGVSRPTVYDYLAFLENTYFITVIRQYSRGPDVELRKNAKVYLCDTGLVNTYGRCSAGATFETGVCAQLKRKGVVNYFQKGRGHELDFVVGRRIGYEVKMTATSADVRRAATIASALGLEACFVVSKSFSTLSSVVYPFML